MSEKQVGLFIRRGEGEPWTWEGFFDSEGDASLTFNLLEFEHPMCEAMWFDPQEVFDALHNVDEDEDDDE